MPDMINKLSLFEMANFDFKRSNRKCSVTGRAFDVGEEFNSLLVSENDDLVRRDIGNEHWNGPPDNCVGWWKSRVPDLQQGRVYWAPREVLLAYFQHLIDQSDGSEEAYVMAILLLQKKYLRITDTIQRQDREFMLLSNLATKEQFEVAVRTIASPRVAEIQHELADKLFTNIAPTDELPADDLPTEDLPAEV